MNWTLDSKMPFGKYKDDELSSLDKSYVIWLCSQEWFKGELKVFMKDNINNFVSSSTFIGGDMMTNSPWEGYI